MRTYNERLENIRAKVKATKRAYAAMAVSLTTLGILTILVCSFFFWPELLFGASLAPTYGPALQQPSINPAPTIATAPSQPNAMEPLPTYPDIMGPTMPEDVLEFRYTTVKCSSGSNYSWGPVIIRSQAELELLYEREIAQFEGLLLEFDPIASVREQVNQYDDVFFADNALVVLMKKELGSLNGCEATDVFWAGRTLYINVNRKVPGIGKPDTEYWYLFIEVNEVLPKDTDICVQYMANDAWMQPAWRAYEISFESQKIYYGVPDMDAKYPRTDVIRSVAELQTYLAGLQQDLSAETAKYDETFFKEHTLLALWNRIGSSSAEYVITNVWRMDDYSISICGEMYSPNIMADDAMSWLVFVEAKDEMSHYAKITVEYETIEQAVPPERPENTNLEFWIGEDVANVDFSGYDEIHGWFGAREYLGNGYSMILDGDCQPTYPQTYVSYLISAFPDESDGGSYVTRIEIRDKTVLVYGLTIQSDSEEFEAVFRAMGYGIYEENGTWRAKKDGITFTFRKGEHLSISVQVTNRNGIIY